MAENLGVKTSKVKDSRTINIRMSDHLAKLAEPKRHFFVPQDDPDKRGIKKSAMKYKATKRIQTLAKPKHVNPKKIDRNQVDPLTQSITSVSPSALAYKPTRRILELAQPK